MQENYRLIERLAISPNGLFAVDTCNGTLWERSHFETRNEAAARLEAAHHVILFFASGGLAAK